MEFNEATEVTRIFKVAVSQPSWNLVDALINLFIFSIYLSLSLTLHRYIERFTTSVKNPAWPSLALKSRSTLNPPQKGRRVNIMTSGRQSWPRPDKVANLAKTPTCQLCRQSPEISLWVEESLLFSLPLCNTEGRFILELKRNWINY